MEGFETIVMGRVKLAFCPMKHMESVAVGLWFKTGSRYETPAIHGGAHFLEHMLFKGTRKRSACKISEAIESRGGDLNAFTSEEASCYYARIGAEHLDLVLDVLFDMLWHSSFHKEEFEREREVILEEIRMYEDQPQSFVLEKLNEALWPDNTLGWPIAGSVESVRGMARARLIDFWRRHYRLCSLTVSVAGSVELQEVVCALKPYLLAPRNIGKPNQWTPVSHVRRSKLANVAIARPIQQCNLAIGYLGCSRTDPRRFAMRLLSVILGENMSSRLFQSVRERAGLAYSINTATAHFHDTGAFYIQAGVERAKLRMAIRLIAKELVRIMDRPPSAAELQRAKDYAIGQTKLGLESTSNRMMWMGESIVGLGHILQPDKAISALAAITATEIQRAASDVFRPGRAVLACLGPNVDAQFLEEACEPLNR